MLYVLSDIELFYGKVLEQNLIARFKIDEYEVSSVATSVKYVGIASIFLFFFFFHFETTCPKLCLRHFTSSFYHANLYYPGRVPYKKKSSAFPFFAIGKFLWWTPKKILYLQLDIGLALLAKG